MWPLAQHTLSHHTNKWIYIVRQHPIDQLKVRYLGTPPFQLLDWMQVLYINLVLVVNLIFCTKFQLDPPIANLWMNTTKNKYSAFGSLMLILVWCKPHAFPREISFIWYHIQDIAKDHPLTQLLWGNHVVLKCGVKNVWLNLNGVVLLFLEWKSPFSLLGKKQQNKTQKRRKAKKENLIKRDTNVFTKALAYHFYF